LTVLYDAGCGFCIRCRRWLEAQPRIVALDFVPAHSNQEARRFPRLPRTHDDELVVVSDAGGVYRGPRAWIMCLWALEYYRPWAVRLARPELLPLARLSFDLLSRNRRDLSRLLGLRGDERLAAERCPTCVREEARP
jgi:predicted DCC family thiol-disulfide oxidoreductase YuxK